MQALSRERAFTKSGNHALYAWLPDFVNAPGPRVPERSTRCYGRRDALIRHREVLEAALVTAAVSLMGSHAWDVVGPGGKRARSASDSGQPLFSYPLPLTRVRALLAVLHIWCARVDWICLDAWCGGTPAEVEWR